MYKIIVGRNFNSGDCHDIHWIIFASTLHFQITAQGELNLKKIGWCRWGIDVCILQKGPPFNLRCFRSDVIGQCIESSHNFVLSRSW